jgi:hypothetical protein
MITSFLIDEIVPQSIDMTGRSGADVSNQLWHRTATRGIRSTLLRRQSWVPLPNRAAALSEQTILTARTDTTTFKRSKHFHAANGTTATLRPELHLRQPGGGPSSPARIPSMISINGPGFGRAG